MIDDEILACIDPTRPAVLLPTASGSPARAEAVLARYERRGGPHGVVLSVLDRDDALRPEIQEIVSAAGLIYLADGDPLRLAQVMRGSATLEGMAQAFASGAVVVGEGGSAAAFGAWVVSETAPSDGQDGLGWVQDSVIVPRFGGAARAPALQDALRVRAGLVGIGLPPATALALGPAGEVETWGEGEVTVVVAR